MVQTECLKSWEKRILGRQPLRGRQARGGKQGTRGGGGGAGMHVASLGKPLLSLGVLTKGQGLRPRATALTQELWGRVGWGQQRQQEKKAPNASRSPKVQHHPSALCRSWTPDGKSGACRQRGRRFQAGRPATVEGLSAPPGVLQLIFNFISTNNIGRGGESTLLAPLLTARGLWSLSCLSI